MGMRLFTLACGIYTQLNAIARLQFPVNCNHNINRNPCSKILPLYINTGLLLDNLQIYTHNATHPSDWQEQYGSRATPVVRVPLWVVSELVVLKVDVAKGREGGSKDQPTSPAHRLVEPAMLPRY